MVIEPLTRREFFCSLAALAVVAAVPLPLGTEPLQEMWGLQIEGPVWGWQIEEAAGQSGGVFSGWYKTLSVERQWKYFNQRISDGEIRKLIAHFGTAKTAERS